MLRSIKDMIGNSVVADDGKIGRIEDFLFEDRQWKLRYLEVETKSRFHFNFHYLSEDEKKAPPATRFLLEPSLLTEPKVGFNRNTMPVKVDREKIKECREASQRRPAETQFEEEFHRYYHHRPYGDMPLVILPSGAFGYIPSQTAYEHSDEERMEHRDRMRKISGEHLHSADSVIGYRIMGLDEELGVLSDMVLNVEDWTIEYLVLDTKHGIPSHKHLIETSEVKRLDWSNSAILLNLKKEDIDKKRRYLPTDPVNHDQFDRDYDYCGKPCLKDIFESLY